MAKTLIDIKTWVNEIANRIRVMSTPDEVADMVGAGNVTFEVDRKPTGKLEVVGGCIYAPEAPVITDQFVYNFWGGTVVTSEPFDPETRAMMVDFFSMLYHA